MAEAPIVEEPAVAETTPEAPRVDQDVAAVSEPAPVVAEEAAPEEPKAEEEKPAVTKREGVRSGGVMPIDGLDRIVGEPFEAGVGFTPIVAIVPGTDRFVLRTSRLVLDESASGDRVLTVAWFHSAPTELPVVAEEPDLAPQMLGLVLTALRDDRFTGDIVAYAGVEPGSSDAKLANEVLEHVFSAAEDLVSRGLSNDLTDDGQLPTPSALMRAAFVEWSGGPRKSETYDIAFARLTAAREPGRLAVAPAAGEERPAADDTGMRNFAS